jgi:hypothetical protein
MKNRMIHIRADHPAGRPSSPVGRMRRPALDRGEGRGGGPKTGARAGRKFRIGAAVCLFLLPACFRPAASQEFNPSEYEIKAAFLFNIVKFVEWPAAETDGSGTASVLGILGRDPFEDVLESILSGKSLKGRPFSIRRFRNIGELGDCEVLFVCDSEKKRLPEILDRLGHKPCLTVGDMPEFARCGGMVELFVENDRVRIAVNPRAVENAGLRVSSKLLNLAAIVLK